MSSGDSINSYQSSLS